MSGSSWVGSLTCARAWKTCTSHLNFYGIHNYHYYHYYHYLCNRLKLLPANVLLGFPNGRRNPNLYNWTEKQQGGRGQALGTELLNHQTAVSPQGSKVQQYYTLIGDVWSSEVQDSISGMCFSLLSVTISRSLRKQRKFNSVGTKSHVCVLVDPVGAREMKIGSRNREV